MNALATIEPLLDRLSDDRLRQLIDFARFLAAEDERDDWRRFGQSNLAAAYGADEPEYTEANLQPTTAPSP